VLQRDLHSMCNGRQIQPFEEAHVPVRNHFRPICQWLHSFSDPSVF
jgi:hypothetical protein